MSTPGQPLHPVPSPPKRGNWYAFDKPYQRASLFSSWTIAGFGLAVGIALVLVYPYRTLESRLGATDLNRAPDRLTVEYLKVFLKAEPGALVLRNALANQLVLLGSFAEAREALQPLLVEKDPGLRLAAHWLELGMREQEAFAVQEGSAQRVMLQLRMVTQLTTLLEMVRTSSDLLLLAHKALRAGAPALAAKAFERIAVRPEPLPPEIYAEAAEAALGLGNYRASADLYFRAMQSTRVVDRKRTYFYAALRTLQAGGRYAELIRDADAQIDVLHDDTQTLLFLARMAQAANRLDAAERYAKRLLKFSLLEQWRSGLGVPYSVAYQSPAAFYAGALQADPAPVRLQRVADKPSVVTESVLSDEVLTLSYNIFLANQNLDDARRVADKAARQQPDSAIWQQRLAHVNEWRGAPAAALPHWLAYARLSGDEAAWDTALKLAIGVADRAAQRVVLDHKSKVDPDNPQWIVQLVQLDETAGQPDQAYALLRSRIDGGASRGALRQRELELLAALAGRTGRDAEEAATLAVLQRDFGPSTAYALRIANQFFRTGALPQALAALERAAPVAVASDTVFWSTYAELARTLQKDGATLRGYRQLLAAETLTENELDKLIGVVAPAQPATAARLAEFGYLKSGREAFALRALGIRVQLADWQNARTWLARLTPKQLAQLEESPAFLSLRSAVAQASNDLPGAERDLRAALMMRPDDMEIRAAIIWILIARRDAAQLRRALELWAADAEKTPVLWDPFAAANMSMNRQLQALHWFRKSGFKRDDYLWLMSYAEALDANASPDLAWRIRRHVWRELRRPEVLRQADPDQLGALRDRLLAVAPLFMGGDETQLVMQALLRADVRALIAFVPPPDTPRTGKELLAQLALAGDNTLAAAQPGSPLLAAVAGKANPGSIAALMAPGSGTRPHDDARLSATARELALAYALNRNANDLAGAWFATRFAAQLAKPLWGELSLALARDDRQALDRMLDDLSDWLPMYDRIEAAQRAGRPALAQTLAFDQLDQLQHDEELHLRLTTLAVAQPANFSADLTSQKQAPLNARVLQVHAGLDLTPGLKLAIDLTEGHQQSTDHAALARVPATDRTAAVTLRMRLDTGFASATLLQRQAAAPVTGLRLEYSISLSPPLQIAGTARYHDVASESALLRVAARRDGVESSATYLISRTEYARLGLAWHRYTTQAGTALGNGSSWNLEVGTHLRLEYPNLTLRLLAAGAHFSDRGVVDALLAGVLPAAALAGPFRVLPQSDRLIGVSLGLGTVVENQYSRAWRPFAEIGASWSEVVGGGYSMRAGVAGSVLGQDLMTLRGLRSSGTAAVPQGLQEIGLNYKWFY